MTSIDLNAIGTVTNPTAPSATKKSDIDKDAFLKLLVAQLKYQDPLKPAEGAEFMAQTAQFTMVEKLTELSEQNAALLAGQQTMAGSSLIGRTVGYVGPDAIEVTGVVTGVRITADGPLLKVGDTEVPLGALREVTAAATAATTTPPPDPEPDPNPATDGTEP